MRQKVSAIVCAYNEEKTIKPILKVLLEHPRVSEVIAVDDGSNDGTERVISDIKHDKFTPIRHPENRGKGAAVASAVRKARGDFLLLVDADLKKFHRLHVDLLTQPLEIDPNCMTIGVRDTKDAQRLPISPVGILLRSFGGERALAKKQIVPLLDRVERSGYGIEAILNLHFIRKRRRIYYIPLPKLIHVLKTEKHPVYKYVVEYLSEGKEMVKQYIKPENKAWELFFQKITKRLAI